MCVSLKLGGVPLAKLALSKLAQEAELAVLIPMSETIPISGIFLLNFAELKVFFFAPFFCHLYCVFF